MTALEWSSALFTPSLGGIAMAIIHVLPLIAVLMTCLLSGPVRAQGPRATEEPAPSPRAEGGAKAARPARVVTVPGEAKVNINSADVKELMTLAGVGRKVAQRIVDYRDAHGPFKKPDDLRRVDGVTDALWEKNRARIAIR
jgi:competence ComEA-like helix-hairpin-helix protein